MTDRICIRRIAIYAFHGLHPEEKKLGQRFYVSLDCSLDLKEAGESDDYAKTICYKKLTDIVLQVATERRFKIIEALAETVSEAVLETFPKIREVKVRVDKPAAPIPAIIDEIFVEICRQQKSSNV